MVWEGWIYQHGHTIALMATMPYNQYDINMWPKLKCQSLWCLSVDCLSNNEGVGRQKHKWLLSDGETIVLSGFRRVEGSNSAH